MKSIPLPVIVPRKKPQVKILYIPYGEYIELEWYKFGVGHFYVERYKEKQRIKLVNNLNRHSNYAAEILLKYYLGTLPRNHQFSIEEFEFVYIKGD